ncbi:hypothetical protein [Dyadobacter sp. NIV53]|uniref:hypothetical protein n=1 Tax=Dyadobacter sp. NIV53 TaxID=2861765 RepID=UPI001C84F884|nr:hypothetical protein [Dyadobacter sp. NIV53]
MKTSSKTSKAYIKNALSEKEIDAASKAFSEHKGPFLNLSEVLEVEKSKVKQSV